MLNDKKKKTMQNTPIIRRLIDIITNGLRGEAATSQAQPGFDPLSHPALKAMSARELADLPFEPYSLPDAMQPRRHKAQTANTNLPAKPGNACLSGACPL